MTLFVSESASLELIAGEICRDALEIIQAIGVGEIIPAEDQITALRAMNAVLRELPLAGYLWPKLSDETALVFSGAQVALPADYYNYPTVWKTVNGAKIPLKQIPHADWVLMANRSATAEQPTHFYIDPSRHLHYWPVPTLDPGAVLQYQRVISDAQSTAQPDLLLPWMNALAYGVANEISLRYGVPQAARMEINQRWQDKKKLALESSIPHEVVSFTVAD